MKTEVLEDASTLAWYTLVFRALPIVLILLPLAATVPVVNLICTARPADAGGVAERPEKEAGGRIGVGADANSCGPEGEDEKHAGEESIACGSGAEECSRTAAR